MLRTLTDTSEESIADIAEEKELRNTSEVFLLFPMGSQFDHLIKQALDRLGVFCLVADPASLTADDVQQVAPKGIILSGGPSSVHTNPPPFDNDIFDLGIPLFGICLGFQMWAQYRGAKVVVAETREYGVHAFRCTDEGAQSPLFNNLPVDFNVLESHGDRVDSNSALTLLGETHHAPVSAGQTDHLYGVQFHPEVTDTQHGDAIFENFCFGICGAQDRFQAEDVAAEKIAALREEIADYPKIALALSGGSDSSVVAHLLGEAVDHEPGHIEAIYIQGIDRPDDGAHVQKYFANLPWLNVTVVDATEQFLTGLAGITDAHEKRVAVRAVYQEVIERFIEQQGAQAVAQGTLYTDLAESGFGYASGAGKKRVKLHHNAGIEWSVPEVMPLANCVKDSARSIGRAIGVPEPLLVRHPFPGPGKVVRISGEVTADRLRIARQSDAIYLEELRAWNLYDTVWQAGTYLMQETTTATKNDGGDQGLILGYWAIWSVNGFTTQAADLPYDFHLRLSQRWCNEIPEIAAVFYRYTGKPPSTVELQ